MAPDTCPNCGADIPRKAKACPECGSCEETGWSDAAQASSLGLPDESFDYDDYVKREFGEKAVVPRGLRWYWWLTAVVLLAAFAVWALWR